MHLQRLNQADAWLDQQMADGSFDSKDPAVMAAKAQIRGIADPYKARLAQAQVLKQQAQNQQMLEQAQMFGALGAATQGTMAENMKTTPVHDEDGNVTAHVIAVPGPNGTWRVQQVKGGETARSQQTTEQFKQDTADDKAYRDEEKELRKEAVKDLSVSAEGKPRVPDAQEVADRVGALKAAHGIAPRLLDHQEKRFFGRMGMEDILSAPGDQAWEIRRQLHEAVSRGDRRMVEGLKKLWQAQKQYQATAVSAETPPDRQARGTQTPITPTGAAPFKEPEEDKGLSGAEKGRREFQKDYQAIQQLLPVGPEGVQNFLRGYQRLSEAGRSFGY